MIPITVSYAIAEKQIEIALSVEESCTIAQAIKLSNITAEFPEIQLETTLVGIFGKRATLETIVKSGDRVEIYRALEKDPKELRRTKTS